MVKVVEAYCALFLGSMMWEARIAVRQHCLLKFPGHFQILFKGFILFAQFSCEHGEFFFSSLLLRDVARETKGAEDVSVGISQRQLCSGNPRLTPIGPSLLFLHVHQRLSRTQNLLFIAERSLQYQRHPLPVAGPARMVRARRAGCGLLAGTEGPRRGISDQ